MVIEKEWADLTSWPVFAATARDWLKVIFCIAAIVLVAALLVRRLRSLGQCRTRRDFLLSLANPVAWAYDLAAVLRELGGFAIEVVQIPLGFGPIWAIATMTVKESIRQRVLYALGFFLLPTLFVGWFLSANPEGRLAYLVSFVWTASSWLIFLMVLFVVAMSIPNDITNKTIQTVVTKPVRRSEIILGRILGYTFVFTGILVVISVLGYAFIEGQVGENVRLESVQLGSTGIRVPALVWDVRDANHTARRPIYASMPAEYPPDAPAFFFWKNGQKTETGTNVGQEWSYRSHIEGDTPDAAFWFFTFRPNTFAGADAVRLNLTFDIFKTTKGNPTRPDDPSSGVFCLLDIYDSSPANRSKVPKPVYSTQFRVNGNRLTERTIPVVDPRKEDRDAPAETEGIPSDVLKRGRLLVQVQCMTRSQFLGMAKHDLYFLPAESSFEWNFAKGMLSLWLQVVFLISIAVTASTMVSGFVAILVTMLVYVIGLWHDWVNQVAAHALVGGGPVEAGIRMVLQKNLVSDLDAGVLKSAADRADPVLEWVLGIVGYVIPNLTDVWTTTYVSEGYDIPPLLIARNCILIAAYVVPVIVIGCVLFRGRETSA